MDDPRQVAIGHARTLGLDVRDAEVIRDAHHSLVRLTPVGLLARIGPARGGRRDEPLHLRNEVTVARYLAGRGAPVVAPARTVDPGPHDCGAVVVSYWTFVENAARIDPEAAGRALARCHALLKEADLGLARCDPVFDALRILGELRDAGFVAARRARRIRSAVERDLEAVAELGLPRQVVHGDAHLENVLGEGREPLWSDWEDTWVAPVEWDLACLVGTAEVTGAGRDRTRSALRGYGVDRLPRGAEVFVRLRAFQVAAWLLTMAADDPTMSERAAPWLQFCAPRRRFLGRR